MSTSKKRQGNRYSNSQRDNRFWLNTWRDEQQYGFHQLSISPLLERFWHRLETPPNSRVLVPLCGKSLDMLWLADQGCEVIGVELSPIAVKAFFSENGLTPEMEKIGNFYRWRSGNIVIWCGDFFALTPEHLGPINAVFDRAALTALPEEWQNTYIAKLLSLIPYPTPLLLLTVEDITKGEGLTRQHIDDGLAALCEGSFTIELLHSEAMPLNHSEQNAMLTAHVKAYLLDAERQ